MKKVHKKTKTTYYLQAVGAAIVHPHFKEVIPLCSEIIRKQNGETKMDCERNAVRRLLKKFRQDHPHLQVIINEDSLSSNAPHIRDLEQYNCHYILGVKEGDHKFLFQHVDQAAANGKAVEISWPDEKSENFTHYFRIVYNAPLNKSNQDVLVTFAVSLLLNIGKRIARPARVFILVGSRTWISPGTTCIFSCVVHEPGGKSKTKPSTL